MIAITIENSTFCAANCLMCVRHKMKNINQNMDNDLFQNIVDDIYSTDKAELRSISFVGTGDPLMDPGFISKIKYIKENTSLQIHLTNTGHLMSGEILDSICEYVDSVKVSCYAVSPNTYRKVHGANIEYDTVVSNIQELLSRKKRPHVTMTFLMIKENEHEKDSWIKKWEGLCDSVDIWLPHNWAGNYSSIMKVGTPKSCNRPGKDYQIHVDGRVSVCCLDVCEDLVIGDFNNMTWDEIKNSAEYNRIYSLHKQGRFGECGICEKCDLLYDIKDALIYSTDNTMKVGRKAGYISNSVDFSEKE